MEGRDWCMEVCRGCAKGHGGMGMECGRAQGGCCNHGGVRGGPRYGPRRGMERCTEGYGKMQRGAQGGTDGEIETYREMHRG